MGLLLVCTSTPQSVNGHGSMLNTSPCPLSEVALVPTNEIQMLGVPGFRHCGLSAREEQIDDYGGKGDGKAGGV